MVAAQVGMPEVVKPVSHKKQPHPAKKGWRGTAAVKTLLEPANSDYASGATLATEGDDGSLLSKVEVGRLKKGAPSDRSGSVAEEEAGWAVQSHGSVGLESEALNPDLQDETGDFPISVFFFLSCCNRLVNMHMMIWQLTSGSSECFMDHLFCSGAEFETRLPTSKNLDSVMKIFG